MNLADPRDVLARTIWGEARGDGWDGMQAVANVVMNRVSDPTWWGHDVISVCLAREQFDCWMPHDVNRKQLEEVDETDPTFAEALTIAAEAISGDLADITHGATSYKANWEGWPAHWPLPPREPLAVIGRQQFYDLT